MTKFEIAFNQLMITIPIPNIHQMVAEEIGLAAVCARNEDRRDHYTYAAALLEYLVEVEGEIDDYLVHTG